jgi:hypothetical protein
MKYDKSEVAHALEKLHVLLPEGATVYTGLRSVSKSGMSRRLRCYISYHGEILDITWYVSRALSWSLNDKGLLVNGCGMDMGFHTVYSVSYALGADPKSPRKLSHRWL